MTDPGVDDLHYGHFGQPVYDVENRTWVFQRSPGVRRVFHPVDHPQVEIPATISATTCRVSSAAELDEQQSHLIALFPELQTAAPLLGRLAQVSNAIEAVASTFDPLTGDLLACGRAADVQNGEKGTISFIALPGGAAGESLRLVRRHHEDHGWGQDKSTWLKVPTLRHGDIGWWSGMGTPIQQIASAVQADNRSTFLAVRTARSIHIFQPRYHRQPVAPPEDPASFLSLPASRLEASPLLYLASASHEQGYADVAFNPWYQRQFGTLDQEGNWTIYDIEGRRGKKSGYRSVQALKGCLAPPLTKSDLQEGTLPGNYDGWGRVLWVNDVNTVLVCNRRILQIADFQGRSVYLSPASLRLARTSSWILDVRRDPHDTSRILVLTSTHLLILKMPVPARSNENANWVDADVLLSWRHFVHEEDTTMRIHACVDEGDIVVFLQSHTLFYSIVFRYRQHEDLDLLISASDPATFLHSHPALRGMHMEALDFGHFDRGVVSGPGNGYRERGLRFFNFHILSKTLEASRMLVVVSDESSGPLVQQRASLEVECPRWIRRIIPQSSSRIPDDSSSVAGGVEEMEEASKNHELRKRKTARLPMDEVMHWRLEKLSRLNELLEDMSKVDDLTREDSSAMMSELTASIGSMDPAECRPNTLYRIAGREISDLNVADVDETAASFSELVRLMSEQDGDAPALTVKPLGGVSIVEIEDGVPSISLTYEKFIRKHVSTMPMNTTARDRLERERLARRLAVLSCLASVKLEVQQPGTEQESVEASQLMDEDSYSAGYLSSEPDYSQSSSYPLPTPEATPSLASEGTFISSMSALTDLSIPQRLSRFGVTSGHGRKQIPDLPAAGKQILAQWKIGEAYPAGRDEGDYYSRRGRRRSALNDPTLSVKKREKLLKQEERRARKQRRETELFQQSQHTSISDEHTCSRKAKSDGTVIPDGAIIPDGTVDAGGERGTRRAAQEEEEED
ncbi:rna polymerase i-specific transcription initiation factor rrn6-like protein [Diplodia corticola]|uniref:Rna polymerase i-specific transcription initiation factor rrn6-like protein n=1 Tax=Diplodia corticola TaxID=236234 RepID=A0A1J9RSJ0_9PEZI|nr:rna polymerase i-specific transcription initiation factor rrn6-like protein [Diplodia corticola]OJD35523.1 rna polymerase i-specific transcription initiation factor rrn6-like protein [Diplodia corticola]